MAVVKGGVSPQWNETRGQLIALKPSPLAKSLMLEVGPILSGCTRRSKQCRPD